MSQPALDREDSDKQYTIDESLLSRCTHIEQESAPIEPVDLQMNTVNSLSSSYQSYFECV